MPQLPTLVLPTPLARAKVNALLDQVVVVGHEPQQLMGGPRVWKVRLKPFLLISFGPFTIVACSIVINICQTGVLSLFSAEIIGRTRYDMKVMKPR